MKHALRDTKDYKNWRGGRIGPPHDRRQSWMIDGVEYKETPVVTGNWVSVSVECYAVVAVRVRLRSKKRLRDALLAKLDGESLINPLWCSVHFIDGAPDLPLVPEAELARVYLQWMNNEINPEHLHPQTVLHEGVGNNGIIRWLLWDVQISLYRPTLNPSCSRVTIP
jgi:hypothetical protein